MLCPEDNGLAADHPDAAASRAKIEVGNVGKARLTIPPWIRKEDGLY